MTDTNLEVPVKFQLTGCHVEKIQHPFCKSTFMLTTSSWFSLGLRQHKEEANLSRFAIPFFPDVMIMTYVRHKRPAIPNNKVFHHEA